MKKFMFCLMFMLIPSLLFAGMVEKNFHHIGDSTLYNFLIPEPEGLAWQDTFRVKKKDFKKDFAFLSFVSHNEGVDISVNGNVLAVFYSELDADMTLENGVSSKLFTYIISVPFEFLTTGKNTVEFAARYVQPGYDDIEFGEVRIWFQGMVLLRR
jgi:hypothetical protein